MNRVFFFFVFSFFFQKQRKTACIGKLSCSVLGDPVSVRIFRHLGLSWAYLFCAVCLKCFYLFLHFHRMQKRRRWNHIVCEPKANRSAFKHCSGVSHKSGESKGTSWKLTVVDDVLVPVNKNKICFNLFVLLETRMTWRLRFALYFFSSLGNSWFGCFWL